MSERRNDQSPPTAVLLEKDGRYFFYQPDTGLIASDESIETAYAKFESARRGFIEEVERAGLTRGQAVGSEQAASTVMSRDFAGELKLFLAKACIVLVLVATVGGLVGALAARSVGGLAAAIDQALTPLKTLTLSDVARKAADIARDSQSLTPQEKESLRQSIGTISREVGPIVDTWRNPPPLAQPTNNPEAAPGTKPSGR